jgi:hypothetical protein
VGKGGWREKPLVVDLEIGIEAITLLLKETTTFAERV